jgi:hypothetical protein
MKIVMDEQIELGFPHIIWTHGWMPCVTNTFNVGFASRDFPFPRFPAFFQSLFPGEKRSGVPGNQIWLFLPHTHIKFFSFCIIMYVSRIIFS